MNTDFADLFNFDDAFDFGASDLELFDILNEGQEFEPALLKQWRKARYQMILNWSPK